MVFGVVTGLVLAVGAGFALAGGNGNEPEFLDPLSNRIAPHEDHATVGEHTHLDESELTASLSIVVVPSEIVVGPNRFAVGLFDAEGTLIHDAQVHFHYYDLRDPERATYESGADARRVQDPDGFTTIFAHDRTFELPGLWGVEVEAVMADGGGARSRVGFDVLADSPGVAPGDRVLPTATPTLEDVGGDPGLLTTAVDPDLALHQVSLADALESSLPTMLLLATPAFCETRFCGPAYEIVSRVRPGYDGRVNFVYAEVYADLPDPSASGWPPSDAARDVGIQTEPWLYFIEPDGTVAFRLESFFSIDEVNAYVERYLGPWL